MRNTASSNSVNLAPLVHILVSAVNSCFYCKSHYVLGSRLELRSQVQILEILLFLKTKFLISITAKKINMTQMNHSSMRKIIMCLYLGLCSYNLESWHVSFVLQSYSKRVFMSLLFIFFFLISSESKNCSAIAAILSLTLNDDLPSFCYIWFMSLLPFLFFPSYSLGRTHNQSNWLTTELTFRQLWETFCSPKL